jgi:hypothetical protein
MLRRADRLADPVVAGQAYDADAARASRIAPPLPSLASRSVTPRASTGPTGTSVPARIAGQRWPKLAGRFSRNACMPSCASSLAKRAYSWRRSKRIPSASVDS